MNFQGQRALIALIPSFGPTLNRQHKIEQKLFDQEDASQVSSDEGDMDNPEPKDETEDFGWWECNICTFRQNKLSSKVCANCRSKRKSITSTDKVFPARNSMRGDIKLDNVYAMDESMITESNEWTCKACFSENQSSSYVCDQCGKASKDQYKLIKNSY